MKRLVPLVVLALALSACSSPPPHATAAFCETYEQSWGAFVQARDTPNRDAAAYSAERRKLTDAWTSLSEDETVSSSTRGTVEQGLRSFEKAMAGDVDEYLVVKAGNKEIAERCSDAGSAIQLAD